MDPDKPDRPGFWAVARRPRWIAALLLCLGLAAGFAGLGQWQLSRSVENAAAPEAPDTEQPVPLETIAEPQTAVTPAQFGRRVTVSGRYAEVLEITDRNNGGTEQGSVLVAQLVTDDGVSLAVALGWSTAPGMPGLTDETVTLTGRYLPSEVASDSDFEAGERNAISVADLINVWPDAVPVYGGYLVLDDAPEPLETIYSPVPAQEISLNLLNIFYAIEWVLFAGFAVYLWYRLVQDVVEKEAGEPTVE
jgi:cytochrome oxidase assembly protein ShyY1